MMFPANKRSAAVSHAQGGSTPRWRAVVSLLLAAAAVAGVVWWQRPLTASLSWKVSDVAHLRLSSDGRYIYTTWREFYDPTQGWPSFADSPRLWDTATGQEAIEIAKAAKGYEADVSPDGRWLVGVDHYGGITMWRLPAAAERVVVQAPEIGPRRVQHWRFSPDGTLLAFETGRDAVAFFDMKERRVVDEIRHAQWPFAFAENGEFIVAARGEKPPVVWDLAAKSERLVLNASYLRDVAVSPDSRLLAGTWKQDGINIDLWEVSSGKNWQIVAKNAHEIVQSYVLKFSNNGRLLLLPRVLGPRLWDVSKMPPVALDKVESISWGADAQLAPDGCWLATSDISGRARNTVGVYRTNPFAVHSIIHFEVSHNALLNFSPDSKILAVQIENFTGTDSDKGGFSGLLSSMRGTQKVPRSMKLFDVASKREVAAFRGQWLGFTPNQDALFIAVLEESEDQKTYEIQRWDWPLRRPIGPLVGSGVMLLGMLAVLFWKQR